MTRREFLIERARGIGGSDIPAVLCIPRKEVDDGETPSGPRTTPLQLYLEKRAWLEDPDGMLEYVGDREEEWHRWGHLLEPLIADEFARDSKSEIYTIDPLVHPDHSELRGNTDRAYRNPSIPRRQVRSIADVAVGDAPARVTKRGILDCKNRNAYQAREWADTPPAEVEAQIQYYIGLANANLDDPPRRDEYPEYNFGAAAVLLGGNQHRWVEFERNQVFIDAAFDAALGFWQRVIHQDPPPATPWDNEALRELYPSDDGNFVQLPDEAVDLDRRRAVALTELKRWKFEKDTVDATLKELMGDSTFGRIPGGGTFKWKVEPRGAYSVPAKEPRILRRLKA